MKKTFFLVILVWFFSTKILYAFNGSFSIEEIITMSGILQAYVLISTIIVAFAAILDWAEPIDPEHYLDNSLKGYYQSLL